MEMGRASDGDAQAEDGIISAEEGSSSGSSSSTEEEESAGDSDVLSRPVPCLRSPRQPAASYAATIVLATACLSIDRRPNNQGMELSVTSEGLVVLDESPAFNAPGPSPVKVSQSLFTFRAAWFRSIHAHTSRHTCMHPPQILFPSSDVLPSSSNTGVNTKLPGHLQVSYTQKNVGPYRRSSVKVARSVVAAAGDRIIRLVDFFVQPIRERNAQVRPPLEEQPRYVVKGIVCTCTSLVHLVSESHGHAHTRTRARQVHGLGGKLGGDFGLPAGGLPQAAADRALRAAAL